MSTYYTAATLARFGDEMVAFTLVLLVLERTGRPGLAGITGAAYALPAVFTGPLLGAWLDRTTHRRAALALNQTVLGVAMIAMVLVVGHTAAWITPALAAVAGATLPMVSGGFSSMLPALVPAPLLARANSIEAASFGAATITGPAAAATLAATVSVEAAAAVIVVSATASILAIARLPVLPPVRAAAREPFLASVAGGLGHLMRTPPLRASTVTSTLALGLSGILLITLPLHTAELGASKAASGYVWTAIEIGSVIAALAGLLEGAMMPAMLTARQIYSPLELQGRVSTTAASLRLGVMAVGQAVGGLLVPVVGTYAALLIVATGLLAAAGLGWVSGSLWTSRRTGTGERRTVPGGRR